MNAQSTLAVVENPEPPPRRLAGPTCVADRCVSGIGAALAPSCWRGRIGGPVGAQCGRVAAHRCAASRDGGARVTRRWCCHSTPPIRRNGRRRSMSCWRLGDEVDVVVFCAGAYAPMRAWEIDERQMSNIVDVNLRSVYHGLELVIPDLRAAGTGALVLVASVAGLVGLPNATVYGPTKAALINLAELLRRLRGDGVDVYLVNQAFVQTPLTAKERFPDAGDPDTGTGRAGHPARAGGRSLQHPLPEALHGLAVSAASPAGSRPAGDCAGADGCEAGAMKRWPPTPAAIGLAPLVERYNACGQTICATAAGLLRRAGALQGPFNDVVGRAEIDRIFRHMFATLEQPAL